MLERYPLSRYPPGDRYRRALFDLSTDGYFACPSRRVARAAAARLPGRAFRYVFSADLSDGAFAPGLSGWLRRFLDREVRPEIAPRDYPRFAEIASTTRRGPRSEEFGRWRRQPLRRATLS